jgi:hypothetical protein
MGLWSLVVSKHTKDVRIIGGFSLLFLTLLFAVWVMAGWHAWEKQASWSEAVKSLSGIASIIGVLGGAIIALIAWGYRTATQRLAVVNTIASDIYSTLRISASLYVVQNLINMYRDNITGTFAYLIAREEYTIIGKINLGDIGFLNQKAIKRINAFYITLRAYRDRALTLAEWLKTNTNRVIINKEGRDEIKSGVVNEQCIQEFRSLICSVIYYAFQCIENGRIALYELLEEPEFRDEAVFVALVQDLRAFTFLVKEVDPKFIQNYLHTRLKERIAETKLQGREDEENYLFDGYRGALHRVRNYIEELHDRAYNDNLKDLFGSNLEVIFGKGFSKTISP